MNTGKGKCFIPREATSMSLYYILSAFNKANSRQQAARQRGPGTQAQFSEPPDIKNNNRKGRTSKSEQQVQTFHYALILIKASHMRGF